MVGWSGGQADASGASVSADLRGDLSVGRLVGGLDEHWLAQVLSRRHRHLLNLIQLLSVSKLVELLLALLRLCNLYLLSVTQRLDLSLNHLCARDGLCQPDVLQLASVQLHWYLLDLGGVGKDLLHDLHGLS